MGYNSFDDRVCCMENVRSQSLPVNSDVCWQSTEEGCDERAAFRRMLLQNASAVVTPLVEPTPPKRAQVQSEAYSHGLELIYALQDVDPSSIRRIEQIPETPEQTLHSSSRAARPEQMSFDFGHPFREWLTPLVLEEPISVLKLSPQAEQRVIGTGLTTIRAVIACDLSRIGLGQGHIHEVRSKLTEYLDGRDLEQEDCFDVGSLLRAFVGRGNVLEGYALLHRYGLADHFPLPSVLGAEFRRASSEKVAYWSDLGRRSFGQGILRQFLKERLEEVMSACVLPWMRRREGLATEKELQERLQRVAIDPTMVLPLLKLAGDLGCGLTHLVPQPLPGLFCADQFIARDVTLIVRLVRSYFYQPDVYYPVTQLTKLVMADLAKQWMDYPQSILEQLLARCPLFLRRRHASGCQILRLA